MVTSGAENRPAVLWPTVTAITVFKARGFVGRYPPLGRLELFGTFCFKAKSTYSILTQTMATPAAILPPLTEPGTSVSHA